MAKGQLWVALPFMVCGAFLLRPSPDSLSSPVRPPDLIPPIIALNAPSPGSTVSTQFPYIEIEFCDETNLTPSSRVIKVNGVTVTSSFSYVEGGGECIDGEGAISTTTAVGLNLGANTIEARISDGWNDPIVQWTVHRVQQAAPVITLKNHNGDNRDRSLCLTVGAGEGAASQCGDLLISHGMPGYATMGKERALTLVYTSAQARPKAAVAVTVNQTNLVTPSSVRAILSVPGVGTDSATYNAWASPGVRQISLAVDASGAATGLYPFTFTVRNIYGGSVYDATVSDTLIVVNRLNSNFGSGWWLAGVEELVFQPGNRILWVGGDGSAKVYRPQAGEVISYYVSAAGGYRDTLWIGPPGYSRALRHGAQVKFDWFGRHLETINRTGQKATFTWAGSPVRLTSIQVPPGVAGTTYTLSYDGSVKLDSIIDPAGRVLDVVMSSGRITSLEDPDGNATQFGYSGFVVDGTTKIANRTTRRGYTTHFGYRTGVRLTEVRVPLNPAAGDSAITMFEPWDLKGYNEFVTNTAVDTASVYTKVLGPRLNVADDATFWIDRWGAPTKVIDQEGAITTYERGNPALPALVTLAKYPQGRVIRMSWNARANLDTLRDSTQGGTGLPTAVTRWTYTSNVAKDSPDSVIVLTPTGQLATVFAYNAMGYLSDATTPNGHVTHFDFDTSASLRGALLAVVEKQMPVWDSVTRTKKSTLMDLRSEFTLNPWGNILTRRSPRGLVTRYTRDNAQRIDSVIDPGGHKVRIEYDALNRITRQTRVDGPQTFVTRWHYNVDVIDTIMDPRGVLRRFEYDAVGHPTGEIDDYGHRESRFFNAAGFLDSIRPRFFEGTSGLVLRFHYDKANRLTKRAWPERDTNAKDSIVFSYDSAGRMLTAVSPTRRIERAYWANGALKSELQSSGTGSLPFTNTYGYDRAGRRLWYLIGPGSLANTDSVWYRHHPTTGDLQWIGVRWRGNGSLKDSVRIAHDPIGRRDTVVFANGLAVGFAYDEDGHLRSVCSMHPGGATPDVFDFQATQVWIDGDDMLRRNETKTECGGGGAFLSEGDYTYDARHQVTFQGSSNAQDYFSYDSSANLTRWTRTGTQSKDHVFEMDPGHNQLARMRKAADLNDGTDFVYDVNGARVDEFPVVDDVRLTATLGRRLYWYDSRERLTGTSEFQCTIQPGGNCFYNWVNNISWCTYDPLDRLATPCDLQNRLGFDDENVVRTASDNDAGWTFVHGPGMDDPLMGYHSGIPKFAYWVTDGKGRQLAVGDYSGIDLQSDVSMVDNGGKYAGGTKRANSFGAERYGSNAMIGLSFFRNRFYDQQTGRWTQEDPIGLAGGMNLYSYSGNNPIQNLDPFGLKICFKGTLEERLELKRAFEEATNTIIMVDANWCIVGFVARGRSGYSELQKRLAEMINDPDLYRAFVTKAGQGRYDHRNKIMWIDTKGPSYWVLDDVGRCTRDVARASRGAMVAHEALGHAYHRDFDPAGRGASKYESQVEAVRVENLYHYARAEELRCTRGGI